MRKRQQYRWPLRFQETAGSDGGQGGGESGKGQPQVKVKESGDIDGAGLDRIQDDFQVSGLE